MMLHGAHFHLHPDQPFKEETGTDNISFAGRTMVVAPGLADEKKSAYAEAVDRALANPEYLQKEADNKNNIVTMTSDEITEKIAKTKEYVESVKFWEQDIKTRKGVIVLRLMYTGKHSAAGVSLQCVQFYQFQYCVCQTNSSIVVANANSNNLQECFYNDYLG